MLTHCRAGITLYTNSPLWQFILSVPRYAAYPAVLPKADTVSLEYENIRPVQSHGHSILEWEESITVGPRACSDVYVRSILCRMSHGEYIFC